MKKYICDICNNNEVLGSGMKNQKMVLPTITNLGINMNFVIEIREDSVIINDICSHCLLQILTDTIKEAQVRENTK